MAERLQLLIVDGEEPSRMLLEELLGPRGHNCASVGSLEEAKAALAHGPYDLVILDPCLPGAPGRLALLEHGFALQEAVHGQTPKRKRRTYLLVRARQGLTATEAALAYEHGCDALVIKGDRARLLAKISEAESAATARRASRGTKGVPLSAKSWDDCTVLLGQPTLARSSSGRDVTLAPAQGVEKVLYQFLFGDGKSDLRDLSELATTRRSLARDARKFLRSVFAVASGPDDPLPWEKTRRAWVSRVRLRERNADHVRGAYEELRRRESVWDLEA